ncbi:MAG: tRNA (adenosine(37)-N6)-threonylcarbamoyltransferase complex ATPase subunit type 1 TsaE [Patescibacteria group bacterium]|nr:tRNA (adenosine(37)-N6)-threonylcarbamoyltransferase complex ATPase subunit type 1 TsaE [Patescibacteria group bacterium]
MMKKQFFTHTNEEMWNVARETTRSFRDCNVVLLRGELGAGKTTFAQGILKAFGAEEPFTSPTFVIMKKYDIKHEKFENVYHFDCYRVNSYDIEDLGWKEIISNKKNCVLVEWPEKIWDIIPEKYCLIDLSIIDKDKRKIDVNL